MLELFKIAGRIDLEGADKAEKDLSNLDKKGGGFAKNLGGIAKKAAKGAAVIGAALVGVGVAAFAMTKKVTGGFDDIAKNSTKLGVSTDAYQEMTYWASQNGISHGNMEKAVGRLNQRIGDAKNGNEKYSNALTALGVNMDDVRDGTVSTEDAMYQSISALSEMTNEQDKAALASELFGTKLGRELMPALQDGSLSLEDAKKKAQELGIVIEEDTLNAAEEFNDTWDDMTRMMGAFGQKIIAEMMPIFQSLMEWVMEHMPQIQAIFEAVFDVIGFVFGTAIEWVQSLIAWFSEWFDSNEETMNGIWETISEVFTNIFEFLTETWGLIQEMWAEHGEAILEYATFAFNNMLEIVTFAFNAIWAVIQTVLNLVWPFIQKTLDKIFKFWDKNGDNIMRVVKFYFDYIKGVINFVMPFITTVIQSAWQIISGIFGSSLDVIMGLISIFSSLLTGDWSGLWEGLKDTTMSVLESLANLMKAPINAIIGVVNGMINAINGVSIKLPKIPDWIPGIGGKGGGKIGFNIPNIPSLAVGGVVHDPTLAMVGDAGKGNPEIVTPEKMMRGIFEESLSKYNNNNGDLGSLERLLVELIQAVREGKNIVMDTREVGKMVGPHVQEFNDFNDGRRGKFVRG